METLAERNQNTAKRQLYYIFVLVAGLIAVLFLLFIIKKITKRFTYRKSSYQILVFGRSNTADRALYFICYESIKKWSANNRFRSPKLHISGYLINNIAWNCHYGIGYYHRFFCVVRTACTLAEDQFRPRNPERSASQPLKDCRSTKKNSYLKLFNSRRRSTMTQETFHVLAVGRPSHWPGSRSHELW